MRLIDADALEELFREVIGNIAKKPEMNGNLEHMVRASAMVIEMIKDAPTIEPEPHWIPVTERLPDMKQIVIITNGKGNVRCGQYRGIDFAINGRQHWQWKGNTSELVTAWMPLPEPWEGEEKND